MRVLVVGLAVQAQRRQTVRRRDRGGLSGDLGHRPCPWPGIHLSLERRHPFPDSRQARRAGIVTPAAITAYVELLEREAEPGSR
jgi:hypothetical protein